MKKTKIFASVVLLSLVLIFAFYKTRDLILGQTLLIENPTNGSTLDNSFTIVVGTAPQATLLTINGAKVLTDDTGKFKQALVLGVGYNRIEIRAIDRFNRQKTELLELVYRPGETKSIEQVALFNK